MHIHVSMFACAHVCRGQRSTLGIFLYHSPPSSVRCVLSLRLELINLAKLGGQRAAETHLFLLHPTSAKCRG